MKLRYHFLSEILSFCANETEIGGTPEKPMRYKMENYCEYRGFLLQQNMDEQTKLRTACDTQICNNDLCNNVTMETENNAVDTRLSIYLQVFLLPFMGVLS